MTHLNKAKLHSERGSAGVKLLIAAVIFGVIGNALYNYVPTAYQGQNFQQDMGTAVTQGVTMPSTYGKPADIVKQKVTRAIQINDLPYDTYLDVKEKGNIITARVYYKKEVPILPFGLYSYEYVFDHSATPGGFLTQ